MLEHLKTTYGTLTPEALESNCTELSTSWNPNDPLENLWKKIVKIQRVATAGGAPITDVLAITLTLAMFENSLLATTTQAWRVKPVAQWTWASFKPDFTLANTERVRQTTTAAAGYHGANAAAAVTPGPTQCAHCQCRRRSFVLLLDSWIESQRKSLVQHLFAQGGWPCQQRHRVQHAGRQLQH
jgi:hypothetical protein